ncbi:MAG: NeuD/PglB/VioB family sugar acetyltransferase [Cyclobacteriaceae bacterium]|jgi:sugar O-acyltransferase (sialic acid O-acetyltransferase NeuD family)|nr:NeuD/PglB/VioB family sugar acetyltransferase [Cyclobacteriaceae bacterium]
MENPVIIFGANYLGRAAKDIFETNGNVVYGFLDDAKALHGTDIDGATVLGNTDDDGFLKLIGKKCEAFIAADDNRLRKSLITMLNEVRHIQPVNAIHHHAWVSGHASIGHGNYIDANVQVSAGATIGNHCIVQAGVILMPEVKLGDFVQVGAGSVINAGVTVEEEAFIGSGVIIVSGVTIGKGARVGAGSVVIGSVKAGETVFGNPAQPIKS